jgi:HSP90 family molecular chaperone
LIDPIDEYFIQQLKDSSDHKLICLTKKLWIDETKDEKSKFETMKTKLEESMKKIIGEDCEKVEISNDLSWLLVELFQENMDGQLASNDWWMGKRLVIVQCLVIYNQRKY